MTRSRNQAPKSPTASSSNAQLVADLRGLTEKVEAIDARLSAVEEKQKVEEEKLKKLEIDLNDTKRQVSKICVVLSGRDVPIRAPNENCRRIFAESVMRKYGLIVVDEEVSVVHRRADGSLIAKFLRFGPNSTYEKLVKRHLNWNPKREVHIYVNILLTKYDQKIRFYANCCKKAGTIDSLRTERSGKISIRITALDNFKPVHAFDDLREFITPAVTAIVEEANDARRRRRAQPNEQGPNMDIN